MTVKIDAHSYKAFREIIRGDRQRKLTNLMLRSKECEIITVYTNLKNICYGKIFPQIVAIALTIHQWNLHNLISKIRL